MKRVEADETEILVIDREEFLEEYWTYQAGEHTTVLGPTGTGKTHLVFQLIEHTATPELPAVIIVMKPRDETLDNWGKRKSYRMVRDWPPQFSDRFRKKPPGYILKPDHDFDPDIDTPRHRMIFRRAILGSYKRGNRILFADELYSLCDEMDLDDELVTVWTKGRSMEAGLWSTSQKPSHIPLWAYSQATHLFLAYDPDDRAQKRFAEISGVDPELVKSGVNRLEGHQWLYVNQRNRTICILDE
ncbi:hypothetical protein AB0D63_43330 [Kitasatospora sp. NPDC048343]|uniref:hypothetical protein n=1 Tax=Kitasatospora sp. NPDC048343 TaxID=3154717 RepID=UPI0033C19644